MNWSLEEIAAGIAILTAIVLGGRKAVSWLRRRWNDPAKRYLTWFLKRHSEYWNPYLNAADPWHDIDRTFIPLHVGDEQERTDATAIISDPANRRMVLTGQPGSGKSTVLRAFGVRLARAPRRAIIGRQRAHEVPFLISLRSLGKHLSHGGTLGEHIVQAILVDGAGLPRPQAEEFFRALVSERRCVLLLDGLDEVAAEHYEPVKEAIAAFAGRNDPALPTSGARLVLACRTHNFRRIRLEWLGERSLVQKEYELGPLRPSEIVAYLSKLRHMFRCPDGPEYFVQEVRAANALRMHTIPLVLAMSVGLFRGHESFEIPTSLGRLYDLMIDAMLQRHSSRHDPHGRGAAEVPGRWRQGAFPAAVRLPCRVGRLHARGFRC